jgi:hypothetical protein
MCSNACVPEEEETSDPAGENADPAAEATAWQTYVGASLLHHTPCTAGASGTTMLLCDATDWRPSVHQRYLTGHPLRQLVSRLYIISFVSHFSQMVCKLEHPLMAIYVILPLVL